MLLVLFYQVVFVLDTLCQHVLTDKDHDAVHILSRLLHRFISGVVELEL